MATLALVPLGSCHLPTSADPVARIIVYGYVTGMEEAGVANVGIVAEAHLNASCTNPTIARDSLATNVSGYYRTTLSAFGERVSVCVLVRVASAGYAADSVERVPLEMRSLDRDSVRVDFQLP